MSVLTVGVMYGTGLLMSLSPCALSLLPLTISYIAGTEGGKSSEVEEGSGNGGGFDSLKSGFIPSAAFAVGMCLRCLVSGEEVTGVMVHTGKSMRRWHR